MKIAYLHGLDANNLGPKNEWLKSISKLVDPQIDYREKYIYQTIRSQIFAFNPDLIIGSSMGGYFAYELAKELNITALLFNPALHSRSVAPDMTSHEIGIHTPIMRFVFGKNDETINPIKTMNIIQKEGYDNYTLGEHGHGTPLEVFKTEITQRLNENAAQQHL
jgi:predicted esterase YcpF (UPF0227 family)